MMIHEWLTVEYHPVWDLVRLTQVTLAIIVGLWLFRVAVTRHSQQPQDDFTRWAFIGMVAAVFLGVLQAASSLGDEFVIWRTPLFLFMLGAFWKAVTCKL